MSERRVRRVSLVGQAVEDLSFTPLEPRRFTARLTAAGGAGYGPFRPIHKGDGFFVFSDLPSGEHRLELSGSGLQSRAIHLRVREPGGDGGSPELPVVGPPGEVELRLPGENELIVRLTAVEAANGGHRLSFPATDLHRPLRAGSRVLAEGFETTLLEERPAGAVMTVKVADAGGLAEGSIIRVVRDASLRLRHGPYSSAPTGLTRVVGRITEAAAPDVPVPGVAVRVTAVNGSPVAIEPIAGARLAEVALGNEVRLLGVADDLATESDEQGFYNLYFPRSSGFENVTLGFAKTDHSMHSEDVAVAEGRRTRFDVELERA